MEKDKMTIRDLNTLTKYDQTIHTLVARWRGIPDFEGLQGLEGWEYNRRSLIGTSWVLLGIFLWWRISPSTLTFGLVVVMSTVWIAFLVIHLLLDTHSLKRLAKDMDALYHAGLLSNILEETTEETTSIARKQLTKVAFQIILQEKLYGTVHPKPEESRGIFRKDHALFLKFGLVNEDWKVYFESAEKLPEKLPTEKEMSVAS